MRTRKVRIAEKQSAILDDLGRFALNIARDNAHSDESAKENLRSIMLMVGSLLSLMDKPALAEIDPITQVKYVSTIPAPLAEEEEETDRTAVTIRAGRDVA